MDNSAPPLPRHPLLLHGPFVRFLYVRVAASIAWQMQAVAVGWQMYALTGSSFQLGLVGLVQFVPAIALFLPTGHAADRVRGMASFHPIASRNVTVKDAES